MADLKEAGFWVGLGSLAGSILWPVLQYMRKPTFVRATRVEELVSALAEARALAVELRAELTSTKGELEIRAKRIEVLSDRLDTSMSNVEWYRERYEELMKSHREGR